MEVPTPSTPRPGLSVARASMLRCAEMAKSHVSIDVASITSSELEEDDMRHHRARAFELAYNSREGYARAILAGLSALFALFANALVQAVVADQSRDMYVSLSMTNMRADRNCPTCSSWARSCAGART